MRLHELSRFLERDSQSVFFSHKKKEGKKKENKIKITKRGKNVKNIA